jgi:hypothetical protein
MGGFWSRFTTKANGSVNGTAPDPPPDIPHTEPRMATDLGDALTAYWRNGQWFGSDALIKWMIDHGHLSEAAYALEQVMKAPRLAPRVRQRLTKCAKDLDAVMRATDTPPIGQAREAS